MKNNLMDEPDIGSGEKTPGELETEEQIRRIPPLPERESEPASGPGIKPSSAAVSAPAPR